MKTMSKPSFKHGEMIIINHREKDETKTRQVAARVVAYNEKTERMNVFSQGRLMWINASQYVGPADKTESLSRGSVATLKSNMASVAKSANVETKIVMTSNHERVMTIIKHNPGATIESISDAMGKSTPSIKMMVDQLETGGFVTKSGASFKLTATGEKHNVGTEPKPRVAKMKSDKSGEVVISKKDRVLALLKQKDMTVSKIAELTGAAPSYIRGVRERSSKTMETPEKGTIKRAVFDSLRRGMSLAETALECRVTVSYAYQIRQQMINAKIV